MSDTPPERLKEQVRRGQRPLDELADELLSLPPAHARDQLLALMQSYRRCTAQVEVASYLGSKLELAELIRDIVFKISEILDADRTSLFLVDRQRRELWSKVAQGLSTNEIRVPLDRGLAGAVATSGEALNLKDVYEHPLFNPEIDKKTGYRTLSMLALPISNQTGEIIGVVQVINKHGPEGFTPDDQELLRGLTGMLALSLENALLYERVLAQQRQVESLLNVANALTSELDLTSLIQTIMGKACSILDADRATLFLIDRETNELWSKSAQGGEVKEIRFPRTVGIAGHVASTGKPLNIPDAYQSPLFNPAFDKQTGYTTKTILCMPIRDKSGDVMGVTQLINKRTGLFTGDDEQLLQAFSAQAAIALQNAQLYDSVLNLKNYLESVLNNLSNGVLSVDTKQRLTMANLAAARILELAEGTELIGRPIDEALGDAAAGFVEKFQRVLDTGEPLAEYDRDYKTAAGKPLSMNVSIQPLKDQRSGASLGSVAILEDMTREKRTRSMMTRLLSKDVAEQLLSGDWESMMKGARLDVTVLFSDIRSFTTITEKIGAHETVAMLNEYFSHMVDAIFSFGGTLDKFIGDAIMAIFGAPVHHPENAVHAVHAAIEMGNRLKIYNAKRVQEGKMPIQTGIGLSSGDVLCGTIGSEKKMEYTAIGDGVNLASRLEGANKYYGTSTLISEFTYRRASTECRVREIDRVRVKGKKLSVTVYELLGFRETQFDEQREALLAAFDEGMRWVGAGHYKKAFELFDKAVQIAPEDKPSKIWHERTQALVKVPPSPEWDGSYELTDK